MRKEILEQKSTKSLQSEQQFTNFALNSVWFGAAFAFVASGYRYFQDGVFPTSTFIFAFLALLASIPVYYDRKRIVAVLKSRV